MTVFVILVIAAVIIFLLYLLVIMPAMGKRPSPKPFQGYYYAHRGLHSNPDIPENSLAAFRRAVSHGYGIELDVQLTRDEQLVVFHDESLNRVCGRNGAIREYTLSELQGLFLFDSRERIPKLEEVLSLVAGKVPLIIEIKSVDRNMRICELTHRALLAYKGLYCIESFNPLVLNWFKRHEPGLLRGQLASNYAMAGRKGLLLWGLGYLLFNFWGKPDFIAYDRHYVNTVSRRLCRNLFGSLSVAWTVTSQKQLEQLSDHFDLFIFEGFLPKNKKKGIDNIQR